MSSLRSLKRKREEFLQIRHPQDLAELLNYPLHRIKLLALEPRYHVFHIPKEDGSKRLIENPEPSLKYLQRQLNAYLQAIYYFVCTEAAYGFIKSRRRDPDIRNILTHAEKHLGCKYLVNIDIEDFFHHVSYQKVWDIFTSPPFNFDKKLALLLADICCYKERLPMGAPTSPALSNFGCRQLDEDLLDLASWGGWTFTRFADDMSFSSNQEIPYEEAGRITQIVEQHGYHLNPDKFKRMGPEDTKIVTGLRLEGTEVMLPENYLPELHQAIAKLGHVLDVQSYAAARHDTHWVEDYQDKVEGLLTFATFVLGEDDPEILRAEKAMDEALKPSDEYSSQSWLTFVPYT